MNTPAIVQLHGNGPDGAGLWQLELDAADFSSPVPEQHWHVYFEDPDLGLTVGAWTTTPMQEAFGPYPGDEFMIILQGDVLISDGEGGETPVPQGSSFAIRNGLPVSWVQKDFCRKFFVIHDPPNRGNSISDEDGSPLVVFPQNNWVPGAQEVDPPARQEAVLFRNDSGTMRAGVWRSAPFEGAMRTTSQHELVHLLSGEFVITEAAGTIHKFAAGDVFFVPAGTTCSWQAGVPVHKQFCLIEPAG